MDFDNGQYRLTSGEAEIKELGVSAGALTASP